MTTTLLSLLALLLAGAALGWWLTMDLDADERDPEQVDQ